MVCTDHVTGAGWVSAETGPALDTVDAVPIPPSSGSTMHDSSDISRVGTLASWPTNFLLASHLWHSRILGLLETRVLL